MSAKRLFLVAAEPSGDLLALETVNALKALDPMIEFGAIGGEALASIDLASPIDVRPLSILGLFEGLRAYPTVVRLVDEAVSAILAFAPDTVVLVDSWGFTLRVAQKLRKRAPNIKLVKLVGPQVWATRPGRAGTLSAIVDHLICLHAMEAPYYAPFDLPVTVMGPPALSRTEPGDGVAFRKAMNLLDEDRVLLTLPGSRPSEIERTAPALVEAALSLRSVRPDIKLVFAPAPQVRDLFLARFGAAIGAGTLAPKTFRSIDLMAGADLALACSGTVTSELAVQGTPFLVGYKTGWITWFLARYLLYKPIHITLLNIAAGDEEVVPEFVQTRLRPERILKTALELLDNPDQLTAQVCAQNVALKQMGAGETPAPVIAAHAILSVMNARK